MREDMPGGGLIDISRSEAARLVERLTADKAALARALERLREASEGDSCNGWTSAF